MHDTSYTSTWVAKKTTILFLFIFTLTMREGNANSQIVEFFLVLIMRRHDVPTAGSTIATSDVENNISAMVTECCAHV